MENVWIERKIGKPKENRPKEKVEEKTEGLTEGGIYQKKFKGAIDEDNILKLRKKIMVKNAPDYEGFEGGEVCEYIGSNLANLYLPKESAKFRLHIDTDDQKKTRKVAVASTFIDNFQTVHNDLDEQEKKVHHLI